MLKQQPSSYLFFVLSVIFYVLLGYAIERHETLPLFVVYFTLFLFYAGIISHHQKLGEDELRFWTGAGIAFRAVLLFSVPTLSDDFYRFIWDGRLLAAGYHPFAEVPSFYMSLPHTIPGIDGDLYDRLNAKDTYTIYPPVPQFVFWLAAKVSPESIAGSALSMKVMVFGFELATLFLIPRILREFRIPETTGLLYALNPLVIIELTGNLHHEGIMLFFLLLAVYLIRKGKTIPSAACYALAICTKLIPLLFLPLLVGQLGWKKALHYWGLTLAFSILFFLPILNKEIVAGMATSLTYYFQRFEFNASLYYLVREAGYLLAGFNIIQYAGPALAAVAATLILYVAFRRKTSGHLEKINHTLFLDMLVCLSIYFFSATIIHPWYIITLLGLSLLTAYRFPLVWTALIFLSYAGYSEERFTENLFLIGLEYTLLIAYVLYETLWIRRTGTY